LNFLDGTEGEQLVARPLYVEALKEPLGGALAPDAKATARHRWHRA
jgi:hypothetical protein